jgi:hypothetical protein
VGGWRTACLDNRGVGGVAEDVVDVEVAGAGDVVVVVADAVDIAAADVAAAVVAEGAGRMDAYWDSSVGLERKSEVLACKTGQDRWNIQRQKQIAIESASGVTAPATVKGITGNDWPLRFCVVIGLLRKYTSKSALKITYVLIESALNAARLFFFFFFLLSGRLKSKLLNSFSSKNTVF